MPYRAVDYGQGAGPGSGISAKLYFPYDDSWTLVNTRGQPCIGSLGPDGSWSYHTVENLQKARDLKVKVQMMNQAYPGTLLGNPRGSTKTLFQHLVRETKTHLKVLKQTLKSLVGLLVLFPRVTLEEIYNRIIH